jgi:uncharacterized membrane protein YagU involved in acid resistance
MKTLLRGAIAGVLATGAMSVVIALGKVVGLLGTPPPKQVTANAGRQAGIPPRQVPQEAFTLSWLAAHVGFGVTLGVLYSLLRGLMPGPVGGLIYGGIVWATNYVGILPELGLYPAPQNDSKSRMGVMIVAHAVYGVSLAELEDRWTE